MKNLFAALTYFLFFVNAYSIPIQNNTNHHIIIDSDCAIDDMRAISMLLSRPEITIEAILASDGTLPPAEGVEKLKSLLHVFGKDSIPVASGPALNGINPPWRSFNEKLRWAKEKVDNKNIVGAQDCLADILQKTKEKIIIVCLGPLTNISRFITDNKSLTAKIERIIWYNESINPMEGFNFECDKESADFVLKSGVRIDVISNLGKSGAIFDMPMFDICKQSNTKLSESLSFVHSQKGAYTRLVENHFRFFDDLAAIYLTNPELFNMNISKSTNQVRYCQDYNTEAIREVMVDMISGKYISEKNIVFNKFPDNREQYTYDVRQIIDSAIARYGKEEWKAVAMTDEFHGHLGVYSIVGAKMGILAREYFGVGPDMLDVTTFAGTTPPFSCLNDGIQVSTGATLGVGLIHLANDSTTKPEAVFTYRDKSIRISLKKEYLDQVKADINEGIVKYGLADDGYWKLIRRNALKYWLEWDRNKIFTIETIKN